MADTAVAALNPIPTELTDAFRCVFGKTSVQSLSRLWGEPKVAGDLAALRRAFLQGMVYGLPSVSEKYANYLELGVPEALQDRQIWNVFMENAHACGIGAIITWLHTTNQKPKLGARRLAEATVPHYLSFTTVLSHKVAKTYEELLTKEDERKAIFESLVNKIDGVFADAAHQEIAQGIYVLLEALLVVREKREEATSLTVDLCLPLSCSFIHLLELASKGDASILGEAKILERQNLLKQLPSLSFDQIVDELERAGKYAGRGVCELSLRDEHDAAPAGLFRKTNVWTDHTEAPLSRLYGLNWDLPSERDQPNVRMILLGNSTISIQVQADPFFEYLLGNWSYVDLVGKSSLIASILGKDAADAEYLKPTIYRLGRFAYQLAYHNHGATIDVNFDRPKDQMDKLTTMKDEWSLSEIEPDGLPLPSSPGNRGAPEDEDKKGFGRLAYALTLQDGLSIWALIEDGNKIRLFDFGKYVQVGDDDIKAAWEKRAPEMGLNPAKLPKGGRHRAAFLRSLSSNEQRKAVFCISQDGFVEISVDGFSLSLR